jgi:NAD(P)-dependent dehydrogenase (short-subunit alcohol dehydrogenase family)
MLIRFDGRTAIVAGAARGIGRTIARSLANDGARVVACDLLVDDLTPIAGRVDGGGEIIAAKVDVTDEASIAEVVRTAGDADILVYVAGGVRGQRPRPLEEVSADDFDAIVDANKPRLRAAVEQLAGRVPRQFRQHDCDAAHGRAAGHRQCGDVSRLRPRLVDHGADHPRHRRPAVTNHSGGRS